MINMLRFSDDHRGLLSQEELWDGETNAGRQRLSHTCAQTLKITIFCKMHWSGFNVSQHEYCAYIVKSINTEINASL